MIQFFIYYQYLFGQFYFCVIIIVCDFSGLVGDLVIVWLFDQEVVVVLMFCIVVFKVEIDDGLDVFCWVDRMFIRLCLCFVDYCKDDFLFFCFEKNFMFYLQFMFYLRRSQFL